MRIQPAHRHAGARQREFVAGLRREIDGQFHLMSRQCFGHARDGNMRRGQGDAQPAPAIIVAEEHHRRAPGFRERREQFGLSDEILFAGADDGFLVHGRGHERVGTSAEAQGRSFLQTCDGMAGVLGGADGQGTGQRLW